MIVRTGIDNALTRFRHVTWLQRRAQFAYFNLICEGDSLTAGAGLAEGNLFPYRFLQAKGLTTSGWNYQIRATGGEDIPDLEARAGATDKYLDQVRSVLCVWIGSNDLVSLPGSAVATEAALASYCADRQRMGWEVAVFTTLPRNAGPTFEADRQAYNTLIRANWHSYADHLVDIGANSTIGDNGDQNNLTYYIVGGVHLTAAGQLIVGNYLATIIT
jgi:lysophospholipase L1-like esterase